VYRGGGWHELFKFKQILQTIKFKISTYGSIVALQFFFDEFVDFTDSVMMGWKQIP
jgi:hypothetical protein